MKDFEWMRHVRSLNRPVAPQRDVWPQIAEVISAQPVQQQHPRAYWPFALAATLVLSLVAGFVAWKFRSPTNANSTDIAVVADSPLWQPQDPRLVAAAADLDVARAELIQALAVTPEAAYLQRLLARTAGTRERLQNLEQSAG